MHSVCLLVRYRTTSNIDLVPCGWMNGDLPAFARVKSPIWKGSAKQTSRREIRFGEREHPSPYKDMSVSNFVCHMLINDTYWLSDSVKWLQDFLLYRISACSMRYALCNAVCRIFQLHTGSSIRMLHTPHFISSHTTETSQANTHIRVCPSSYRSILSQPKT